jgi:4-hydroxybenzoate polyprenyltransferase
LFSVDDLPAWLLFGAVTFWIGGFDVLYACQDIEFDHESGLHSIPARFGPKVALLVAKVSHVVAVLLMASVGVAVGLAWPYWLGLVVMAGLLVYENSLVHPDDLSKLNIAFFNVNGYISVEVFIATFVAILVGS